MSPAATDLFHRESPAEPLTLAAAPRVITTAAAPWPWPEAGPSLPGVAARDHANAARNGRVAHPLPRGAWRARGPVALPDAGRVTTVLDGGDRVVARAGARWFLADVGGVVLARGVASAGEITVDAPRGRMLSPDTTGALACHGLDDGALRWRADLFCGSDFVHPFVHPIGDRVVTLGVERLRYEHSVWRPCQSVLESLHLPAPVALDADGWALPPSAPQRLFRETTHVLAAWDGRSLVVATDDRLYRLSPELEVLDVMAEGFSPRALSVDDAGRAWVVGDTAQGTLLVVVTPAAEVCLWHPLPDGARPLAPPLVGQSHRGFVLLPEAIVVASPEGAPPWRHPMEGAVVGATVTGDDHLLVAYRNELVFYDRDGRVAERVDFGRATLSSAPVLTARGDILVGGMDVVHRVAV